MNTENLEKALDNFFNSNSTEPEEDFQPHGLNPREFRETVLTAEGLDEESEQKRMVNRIIEALAVCLADQYGETVTATITKQETKNRKSETEKSE